MQAREKIPKARGAFGLPDYVGACQIEKVEWVMPLLGNISLLKLCVKRY
jgi:hypothetical protein